MRKIIQIAFCTTGEITSSEHGGNHTSGDIDSQMYALCDDGTVWRWDRKDDVWRSENVPSIPQEK